MSSNEELRLYETLSPCRFIRAKTSALTYVCRCYTPPNGIIARHNTLVSDAGSGNPNIIAGDFSAWSVDRYCRTINIGSPAFLENFVKLDLIYANNGKAPDFWGTPLDSIVDLTYISTPLVKRIDWIISERYTHSDLQAIFLQTENESCSDMRSHARGAIIDVVRE